MRFPLLCPEQGQAAPKWALVLPYWVLGAWPAPLHFPAMLLVMLSDWVTRVPLRLGLALFPSAPGPGQALLTASCWSHSILVNHTVCGGASIIPTAQMEAWEVEALA